MEQGFLTTKVSMSDFTITCGTDILSFKVFIKTLFS
jgi:hypothetical protein